MGKITATAFITLDNVVEEPHLWSGAYQSEDTGVLNSEVLQEADSMLLGRVTYEGFAAAWPSREGEFADKFNNMTKYVVSSTLTDPEWNNSHVIAPGDLVAEVSKLREQPGGDILVNGSVQVARALLEAGLVDELRLMVFPTVLGGGLKLFGDTGQPIALELAESRPAGETQILIYKPKA